jgi:uncharacterized protein YndB with AHSA1/START domain
MKWLKWIFIIPAALILVIFLVLLVASHLPGAGKMHASIEITGTPHKVWPWLEQGTRLKQWISWLVDVQEPSAPGVGTAQTWTMKDENNGGQMMKLVGRCTEYKPESRLGIGIDAPGYGFDGRQTYALTDMGNGRTRLDVEGEYHFSMWFANLMTPLVMSAATDKLNGDMARLKALVEKEPNL